MIHRLGRCVYKSFSFKQKTSYAKMMPVRQPQHFIKEVKSL